MIGYGKKPTSPRPEHFGPGGIQLRSPEAYRACIELADFCGLKAEELFPDLDVIAYKTMEKYQLKN